MEDPGGALRLVVGAVLPSGVRSVDLNHHRGCFVGVSDFDLHKVDSTQRLLRFTRLTNMRRPQVGGVGKHYRCCISALETTQSRWTGKPQVHWLLSTLLLRSPAVLQI